MLPLSPLEIYLLNVKHHGQIHFVVHFDDQGIFVFLVVHTVTLVVVFDFLPPNFGEVESTYEWSVRAV